MKKFLLIVVGALFLFSAQAMTSESCSAQSKRSTKSTKSTQSKRSTQSTQATQSTQKSNIDDGWIEIGEVTLRERTFFSGGGVISCKAKTKPDILAILSVKEIAGSVVIRVYYNDKYYVANKESDDPNYFEVKIDGTLYEFESPL